MLGMILCMGIHGPDIWFCGKGVGWGEIREKVLRAEFSGRKEQSGFNALLALMAHTMPCGHSHLTALSNGECGLTNFWPGRCALVMPQYDDRIHNCTF
jgi:hypothetical protein